MEEQQTCELSEKVESSLSLEKTSANRATSEDLSDLTKQRRKLDKLIDSVLKRSTNTNSQLNNLDDKYYALVQLYVDMQEQNKKLQVSAKETEKTVASLTKQRDQAQNDFSKMLLAKDKLENLCRELQKHNKLIKVWLLSKLAFLSVNSKWRVAILKDDNLHRIKEEEEKRKEISTKFQAAIDDINQQMSTNTERNSSLIQENTQLTTKLKCLLEQYEKREEVFCFN